MGGLEAAQGLVRVHHAPGVDRAGDALEGDGAEVLAHEPVPDQTAGLGSDHHRIRIGRGLQARRDVQSLPDQPALCAGSPAERIARDHKARGDAHAHRQLDVRSADLRAKRPDRFHQAQPGPNGALGVVLVRHRIPEVGQDAVAQILGDVTPELLDDGRACRQVGPDESPKVLGIQLSGDRRGSDEVGEQHGHASALGRTRVGDGGLRPRG